MGKFSHKFTEYQRSEHSCVYTADGSFARLDFVSGSCVRVAVYKDKEKMLPTFCVNPENDFLIHGRDRLSTGGFPLFSPKTLCKRDTDVFLLDGGIEITLEKYNFILEYRKDGRLLFCDRPPLAYNFDGEFGEGGFHYVTREKGEHIFGLGDKGGALDKSGRAFRIETADCMGYDARESDPLYKHIPFYICENSVGCYGVFYDTSDTSYMDFGKEINNYYPPYKYFKTEDDCLVYYVFFGTKPEILRQFGSLCGRQAFPPRWSFDYCASTMAYTDAPDAGEQMNLFLEKLRGCGIPCSGFYLSSGYTSIGGKRCVFNWNREKFPDPGKFIKKFAENGIKIIPNIKPALLLSHPLYGEIAEKGYFVKDKSGAPFVTEFWDGLGSYIDFANPGAFAWWEQKVTKTLLDYGVEATWNDNNEFDIKDKDAVSYGFGGKEAQARRIRPSLTYLMTAASYSAQIKKYPGLRPFLSTRSGNIAVRRLAQTWSGDNRTCFEDLRYCHNIGLTMSMSGLHFYGHDLGGFSGAMPSRELLLRWIQHGIFEPRFTIHSWNEDGSATMPWSYEDILPSVKKLFNQRQRLIPYLYNCAYQAVRNETPVNAPLLLYYDDSELYSQNDCMMVGRDLLVPFIFDEGKAEVSVYLPKKDRWYLGGRLFKGGTSVNVRIAAGDEMPFFVRAGSVVCMGSETEFTVYPLEKGEFKSGFFTDDGVSFNYRNNCCVKLEFTVECGENTVNVVYKNTGDMPFAPHIRLCSADKRRLSVKEKI